MDGDKRQSAVRDKRRCQATTGCSESDCVGSVQSPEVIDQFR